MCVCVHTFVLVHVSVHVSACNNNCLVLAGPETAVLDWYCLEADSLRILARVWGGGAGLQVYSV